MMSAMMLVRSIDQEDPAILLRTRIGFGIYLLATTLIYYVVHRRILSRHNTSPLTVKIPPPPFGPGSDSPPTERYTTVIEYDLEHLKKVRQGWIFNTLLLSAIHYKMETVSPLIMSGLMTFIRLITDDPLVKMYLFGQPSVGKLKRPFQAEENPLASMLKGMVPKPDEMNAPPRNSQITSDDDDTEEEDNIIPDTAVADMTDDHIKGDFEEEDNSAKKEPKKDK